tara:strand:+ start:438 stop:734 length:297 start_codon:yes stop_codon:yes gene_type:complete
MSTKTVQELESIRKDIEKMNKFHQVEILKLLKSCSYLKLNENNNGTFINMVDINDDILIKISNYINYVEQQEKNLSHIENTKLNIKNKYFENTLEMTC